ncbi:phage tail tape measure protein [Streptomyces sp. NPDC007984]|uniref:phage tail tape measure protein n=1 Tax=Streptomyces sp. NPDC007984 TaxID=3364801 RepID=UPI0036E6986D
MALTVGELTALISVNDTGMQPGLRRAERTLEQSGQRMGDEAADAGQQAGRNIGDGVADGLSGLRVEAARIGRQAGDALGDSATTAARRAGGDAGTALGDGLQRSGGEGADQAAETIGQRLKGRMQMAAAGIGLAAGAVLASGFQQALDQGQITARLGAQLGTTPAVAQRYGKVAGQLFKEAIVTDFQAGADAIKAIASSGLIPPNATNAQIKSIAANAHDLADVMEVDVGQAAQAAGTMVKNGLAKNGKEAFDLLVAGSKGLGKAGEDLLETFTEYSPVFKSAGLSGKTAMGLIRQAVAGGWGKDTDKIADAFKELSLQVTSGAKPAADALKSLGLDARQVGADMAAGGTRGEKAMGQVLDALRKVGPDTATAKQAVQTLFGGPGEDLGAALFAMDVGKASKAMGGAKDAADDLGKGLRDSAGHNVTEFKNRLRQGLVEFLGGTVIPALSKLFHFVQDHQGKFKAAAAVITGVVVPALTLLGAKALWAGIQMARAWVMGLGPIGWIGLAIGALVVLIVMYWDEIQHYTGVAWDWVVGKVTAAKNLILAAIAYLGTIPGKVAGWWRAVKDKTVQIVTAWVSWVRGIPGRVWAAISGLAGRLRTAANNAWTSFRNAAAVKVVSFISWVRGIPGRVTRAIGSVNNLLYSKGRNIVTGLWNGIVGMGGWLRSKIMGWARSVIPGPVAKALGIASPSKVMAKQVGRWIPRGIVAGIESTAGEVDRTMANLVHTPTPSASFAGAMGSAMGVGAGTPRQRPVKTLLLTGGDRFGDYVVHQLRKEIAARGGGDVQFVLGKGRVR